MALGGRLAREARRRQVNQGTPAWGWLSVGAAHACAGVCLPVCSAGGKSAVPQCTLIKETLAYEKPMTLHTKNLPMNN